MLERDPLKTYKFVRIQDFLAPFAAIQAKAVAHAVVASILGDTLFLTSAEPEHLGQPGSNVMCVIAEAAS